MQWVGIVPESGKVLTYYHHIICLIEHTRNVNRSRWVCWRTWVVIIICLTKQTRHVNLSIWTPTAILGIISKMERAPPPGGFPIYYVPSSRTVSKSPPLEALGSNSSRVDGIYPSNGILRNKNSTKNNQVIQKSWAC